MKQRPRIDYTESQRALMWDRWRKGDSLQQIGRYAHAKQYRCMSNLVTALKIRVRRVHRDLSRQLDQFSEQVQPKAQNVFMLRRGQCRPSLAACRWLICG